jgi:hypothetical protein
MIIRWGSASSMITHTKYLVGFAASIQVDPSILPEVRGIALGRAQTHTRRGIHTHHYVLPRNSHE